MSKFAHLEPSLDPAEKDVLDALRSAEKIHRILTDKDYSEHNRVDEKAAIAALILQERRARRPAVRVSATPLKGTP